MVTKNVAIKWPKDAMYTKSSSGDKAGKTRVPAESYEYTKQANGRVTMKNTNDEAGAGRGKSTGKKG